MEKTKKLTIIVLAFIIMSMAISTIAYAAEEYDWSDYGMSESEATAFLGLGIAMCVGGLLVWFIVWILIGIWVYKDAEKRGKSGILWLLLVIILGIIGLIIWLVVRPKEMAPK